MKADTNELDRLAYAQASDTLDAEDQALLDTIEPNNPDFMQRLDYWQKHIAGLDLAASEAVPPAYVWNNIESSIATEQEAEFKYQPRYWWQTLAVAASITLFGLFLFWQSAPQINSVNLDNQWLVQVNQADLGPQLTIAAQDPMAVPEGMVCNLWFKTGNTVIGIAQMPINGKVTLDLKDRPQLRKLLAQPGTMMVTIDPASTGLSVMNNQSVINGQWL